MNLKRELAAIEAANKQLQESIAEQEQVFLKQREQMEKAKITLSKMQAEQHDKVSRMEQDFLHAKMKRSVDDIYSNEISVHDKGHSSDKFELDKADNLSRKLSGKSQSKSLSIKKAPEENRFVTINFDSREQDLKHQTSQDGAPDSSAMDKNQIRKQVKNYDMDDQTKAFLENYLLEDHKQKDLVLEKEALPTGLSEDKPAAHSKDPSRDAEAKKADSLPPHPANQGRQPSEGKLKT